MSNNKYLSPGTKIDQYTICKHLASGGFGNTYLATNRMGSQVVIKEFYMSGMCSRDINNQNVTISISENIPLFETQRKKFLKEAHLIHSFSHPNIVKVSDLFEANGTAYYVMDYIEGMSLAQMPKPLSEKMVMHYLHQIMNALEYVHSQNVTHLDIKPSNIMIDSNNNAILIDFGASKLFDNEDDLNKSRTTTGLAYTPGYAPIEQLSNDIKTIGPHSDIYALGATLYNLLTNSKPPQPSEIHKNGLPQIRNISPSLMNTIYEAMKYFEYERIQNVAGLRLALNRKPIPPVPPVPPVPPNPTIWRKILKGFLIILGVTALGIFSYPFIDKIINDDDDLDNDSSQTYIQEDFDPALEKSYKKIAQEYVNIINTTSTGKLNDELTLTEAKLINKNIVIISDWDIIFGSEKDTYRDNAQNNLTADVILSETSSTDEIDLLAKLAEGGYSIVYQYIDNADDSFSITISPTDLKSAIKRHNNTK